MTLLNYKLSSKTSNALATALVENGDSPDILDALHLVEAAEEMIHRLAIYGIGYQFYANRQVYASSVLYFCVKQIALGPKWWEVMDKILQREDVKEFGVLNRKEMMR
jgi:hypothetical protein